MIIVYRTKNRLAGRTARRHPRSSAARRSGNGRQGNVERSAFARPAFDADPPVVPLDDRLARRQAEAGPVRRALQGVAGFQELGENDAMAANRNARSVVADGNAHGPVGGFEAKHDPARAALIGSDSFLYH